MKLTIVIPVYNEEEGINTTHLRIGKLIEDLLQKSLMDDYEIIYVDDGSRDNSLGILKKFSEASAKTRIISFSRNFGHQPALAAGIRNAAGDAIVTLDADLQDPPELIEEMLRQYRTGFEIIYAARKARDTDTFFKKFTARMFYRIMQYMGVDIVFDHADYRLISRTVADEFNRLTEVNLFLRGLFPYLGFRNKILYYDRQERTAGETKYPLRKMLAFAWQGITSFSSVPLKIASFTGFAMSFFALLLIGWAFFVKVTGRAIPGWSSIVIPILFIGGLNIFFLGVIGEYIGKIYSEVKRRPVFIIRERINFTDSSRT